MRIELQQLEQIDAYLNGSMNPEIKSRFESEINQSEELRQLVENQRLLIRSIQRKALLAEINKFSSPSNGLWNFMKWLSAIIVIASIFSAGLYFISAEKEKPFEAQETEKNIPTENEMVTDQEIAAPAAEDLSALKDTECLPAKAENLESVKNERQPQIVKNAPVSVADSSHIANHTSSKTNDLDGLKTWIEPKSQYFEITPKKGQTIECKDGTLIIVPTNAFVDKEGKVIRGKVMLQVVEALSVADMLAYNLTTMNNEKHLQSGGMVYLQPTLNGEKVKINPESPLYIQIPTSDANPAMLAWKGEVSEKGDINWTNPKPLDKFLTPIDFKLLDFLPIGFEQEVNASELFMKNSVPSRTIADSLYYMLKDEKNSKSNGKVQSSTMPESRKTKSSQNKIYTPSLKVPSEGRQSQSSDNVCMINPLSVKAIKTEIFANTFLATKEFEERIRILHQMPDPQKLLDLYCNNLSKNLYEVDSLVYSKLSLPSDKEIFRKFMDQRLTNVQNGNIHQKQLTEYYNSKRKEYEKELKTFLAQRDQNDKQELHRLYKELNFLQGNGSLPPSSANFRRIKPNPANINSYYVIWFETGWVNIDAYLHLLQKGSEEVNIIAKNDLPETRIYQSLNAIQTIVPLTVSEGKAKAKFPSNDIEAKESMRNAFCIGISRKDGKLMYTEKKYDPYNEKEIELVWAEISEEQLYEKLKSLPDADQQTIDGLKRTIEMVETEQHNENSYVQRKMENTQAMQELMSRLLKIARSCGFSNQVD